MPPFSANKHNRKRRGFNLIESAIVLGVIGLVIAGIWTAASVFNVRQKADQYLKDMFRVGQALQSVLTASDVSPTAAGTWIHRLAYGLVGPLPGYTYSATYGYMQMNKSDVMQFYAYNFNNTFSSTRTVFTVQMDELPQDVCWNMASRIKSILSGDSNGQILQGAVFGSVTGGFEGVYSVPNAAFGTTGYRFDSNICRTSRNQIQLAFNIIK